VRSSRGGHHVRHDALGSRRGACVRSSFLVRPVRACVRVTLPAPQLNLDDAVVVALEFGIASTRYYHMTVGVVSLEGPALAGVLPRCNLLVVAV
jgi:hypothetical protein